MALWRRPHRGLALARAARLTSRVDYRLGGLRSRGSDFRRERALVARLRAAGGGVNGGSAALLSFSLSVSVVTLEWSSSRPSDRSRGRQTSTVSFVIRVSAGSDRLRRAARAAMP